MLQGQKEAGLGPRTGPGAMPTKENMLFTAGLVGGIIAMAPAIRFGALKGSKQL